MKLLRKSFMYFFVMLSAAALSACSSEEAGTKEKPASVGQTMHYDGMEGIKGKNRFKADITLEDVVRGEAAEDIFAAAGGYVNNYEALDLDAEEELMVARFTFTLTDVKEGVQIELGERDVNIFSLVSEDGLEYDYFLQRRYVDGNLFEDIEKGATQTGALFYIVDKKDKNPVIVFLHSVNDGIWFKTNLNKKEKEEVKKPLLAADWLGADGKKQAYAGTLNVPLPVGEFGYMKCRSSYFGDYELELRVNDVLRGEAAEEQLYDLKIPALEDNDLLESQEYMMVNLTANCPSAHLTRDDLLLMNPYDFEAISSKSGKAYDLDNTLDLRSYELSGIAPGGTATGWAGFIINKADDSPMMCYRSLSDEILYFKLDKAYDMPDAYASYKPSPVFSENPIRDVKQEKGHWNNPYEMGDIVDLNYKPRRAENMAAPFSGTISVQEAYKGELAEKFIKSPYYIMEPNKDLIVLKLAVNVTEIDGEHAPEFNAYSLTFLTGQGGQVEANRFNSFDLEAEDKLDKVYPGSMAEGYMAFWVPKGIGNLIMTYGDAYSGLDNNAWISLEFSDHIPEDMA